MHSPNADTGAYVYPKFDRKAILAENCEWSLYGLRSMGRARRRRFLIPYGEPTHCQNHGHADCRKCSCASASFAALSMGHYDRVRGIYVDLGCGDSADAHLARSLHHYGFGVDLVAPSKCGESYFRRYEAAMFMRADMCERIPFESSTVDYASCHAVIDLMDREGRDKFYAEVYRVLKPGGLFSIMITPLVQGFGYSICAERAAICRTGLVQFYNRFGAKVYAKPV